MAFPPVFEPYVLSTLDHITAPIHMSTFITFHPENPSKAISALETGLRRLILLLPFISGNVAFSSQLPGKQNVREVQAATAEFLQKYPMLKIKHHDKSISPTKPGPTVSYDTILNEEFTPLEFAMAMEDLSPVFRIQANVMRDGVILCCSFYHLALDGAGCNNVLRALAQCCQNPGLASLATDPWKEAETRRAIVEAGRNPNAQKELQTSYGAFAGDMTPTSSPESPISRVLVLDPEKIERLREACNSQMQRRSDTRLSSNTIISSLIWLCYIRSRYGSPSTGSKLDGETTPEKSCFAMPIDVRKTLQLPSSYMGNALVGSEAFASIDAVLSSARPSGDAAVTKDISSNDIEILAELAHQINECMQFNSKHSIQGLISQLSAGNDWATYARPGDVSVSNMRNLRSYELDFGSCLGRAHNFDLPENRVSGVGWILPSRFKGSPWEVRMALEPEIMERVQRDRLMQWVCARPTPKSKL
jgi:fumigaclavine B O-acetyltransferase